MPARHHRHANVRHASDKAWHAPALLLLLCALTLITACGGEGTASTTSSGTSAPISPHPTSAASGSGTASTRAASTAPTAPASPARTSSAAPAVPTATRTPGAPAPASVTGSGAAPTPIRCAGTGQEQYTFGDVTITVPRQLDGANAIVQRLELIDVNALKGPNDQFKPSTPVINFQIVNCNAQTGQGTLMTSYNPPIRIQVKYSGQVCKKSGDTLILGYFDRNWTLFTSKKNTYTLDGKPDGTTCRGDGGEASAQVAQWDDAELAWGP